MSIYDFLPGSSKEVTKETKKPLDVKKLTKPQLLELLARQNKIISSPAINKLCDKGEKVKLLKQQIEEELERKNASEDISYALTKLSINEKKIEVIEWGEKADITSRQNAVAEEIGFSYEEKDPLAIIATHSGTVHNQRKVVKEEPEEPLVTLADIEEAYALSLCNKIDKSVTKERFLPYKTLNKTCLSTKTRDLSSATPPLPVFGDVKFMSLEESIKLQYKQNQHLKEVQQKHATERLKNLHRHKIGENLPGADSIGTYRVKEPEYNEEESDENEED